MPSGLNSLSERGLRALLDPENILDAREYCGAGGPSNIRELYVLIEKIIDDRKSGKAEEAEPERASRKKKTKRKTAASEKAPKTPREVVYSVLKSLRETREDRRFDYDEFCGLVENDLRKYNVKLDVSCPIQGLVAGMLYGIAELKMIPRGTRKKGKWNLRKTALGKIRTKNPVRASELEKTLGLNFGEKASEQIVGILDEDYVRKNYTFSNGRLIFEEGDGWYQENPSIEGTPNWDGQGKEKSRKLFASFVRGNLLKDAENHRLKLEERVKSATQEITKLGNEEAECTANLDNISRKKKERVYTFSGGWRDVNRILPKKFVSDILRGKTRGMDFNYVNKDGKSRLEVRCQDESAGTTLVRKWNENKASFPSIKDNFLQLESKIEEEAGNLKERIGIIKNTRTNLIKSLDDNKKTLEYMQNNPRVHYLGLEGPNFRSFIELGNAVRESGLALDGMFVEHEYRIFNLMKSIMDAYERTGIFRGCSLQRGDIDEAIMLDFAEDPNLRIMPVKLENGNGNHVEGGREFKVVYEHIPHSTRRKKSRDYRKEEIAYETYDEIITRMDKDNMSVSDASEKYGISEMFARAISSRPKGKFNVVFLDYVGSVRRHDRKPILETLLRRRIEDEAVIATTFNISTRLIPLHEGKSRDEGEIFDSAAEALSNSGYDGVDLTFKTYQDGSDKMSFQAYYIKRRSL